MKYPHVAIKAGVSNYLLTSAIYPFEVFIALLPGALLLPLLIVKKVREDLYTVYQEKFTFCLFIVLINLVPFILLGKSNVRYYLPMFPANFILMAMIYSRCLQGSLSLNIQGWVTYKLPLIITMLTAVTIGGICLTKPLTAYATWTLPVALLLLLVYIVFAIKNKKANDISFVYFCLVIGLSIRLLDLGYTIPRSALKVEKYRNVPMMLSALKHIKQEHNKTIIASPRLSHALYFYDNEHIISPLNCQNKVTDNHLILAISHTSELALPQNNLIKNNIIWQTYYRKNKTLYLYQPTEVNTSPDYCF